MVLVEPGVVVHLAQIVAPGVGRERHHEMFRGEALGVAKCGGNRCAAGAAQQDALTPRHGPGNVERFGVTYTHPVVDQLAVKRLRYEVLANALDLPRPRRTSREYRAFRIGAHDLDFGIALFEIAGYAGDRAPRADTGNEGGDAA